MNYMNRYNITAVAQAYCEECDAPNARRRLNYMIRTYPELKEELEKANYRTRQRNFTPKQYEVLVKYLGEPG